MLKLVTRVIVAIIAGFFMGPLLLGGICNVPRPTRISACTHNYISVSIIVSYLVAVVLAWVISGFLFLKWNNSSKSSSSDREKNA